jgi:hypothetical protein
MPCSFLSLCQCRNVVRYGSNAEGEHRGAVEFMLVTSVERDMLMELRREYVVVTLLTS